MNDIRPDPSLKKFRSEHELFDSALKQSFDSMTFYKIPQTPQKIDVETQDIIRSAITGTAVAAPAVAHFEAPAGAPVQIDAPSVLQTTSEGPCCHHHPHLSNKFQ